MRNLKSNPLFFDTDGIRFASTDTLIQELLCVLDFTEENLAYAGEIYSELKRNRGAAAVDVCAQIEKLPMGRYLLKIAERSISPKVVSRFIDSADRLATVGRLRFEDQEALIDKGVIEVIDFSAGPAKIVKKPITEVSSLQLANAIQGRQLLTGRQQLQRMKDAGQTDLPLGGKKPTIYKPRLDTSGDLIYHGNCPATVRDTYALLSSAVGFDVEKLITDHRAKLDAQSNTVKPTLKKAA